MTVLCIRDIEARAHFIRDIEVGFLLLCFHINQHRFHHKKDGRHTHVKDLEGLTFFAFSEGKNNTEN